MVEGPDGDEAIAIHPVGILVARVGPPRVRRRVRGGVPQRAARRCSRPTTGKPSSRERRSLRVRAGSGAVPYREAEALQRAIHEHADADYLLLLEHPHVYTLGSSAKPEHVLRDPASVGAELVARRPGRRRHVPRPGPARRLPDRLARRVAGGPARRRRVRPQARGRADRGAAPTSASTAGRSPGYTGVWVGDEKIAAIGVRVSRAAARGTASR